MKLSITGVSRVRRWIPAPQRRTRGDLVATAVILVLACLLVVGTWWFSAQRKVDHSLAAGAPVGRAAAGSEGDASAADSVDEQNKEGSTFPMPRAMVEAWSAHTDSDRLITAEGGVMLLDGTRATMVNAQDGQQRWHYDQDRRICGLARPAQWARVILVFQSPKGCGEAISFSAATGQYAYTRSALAPTDVEVFDANRTAGTLSPQRVELWRDDLVRTVEVGQQEAPHQPHQQQYLECQFTSALSFADLLVTAQQCPDTSKKVVRFLATTPKDSEEPETLHEFTVPPQAEVIAVQREAAAIYIPASPGEPPRLQILQQSGDFETQELASPAAVAPEAMAGQSLGLHQPMAMHVGSLSTWFDGEKLNIFTSADLSTHVSVPGALGLGTMVNDRLLVPVVQGIAEVEPASGRILNIIDVQRGDYHGVVQLASTQGQLVELRGKQVVGLQPVD